MSYNPVQTRTWNRSTPNDGLLFEAEYNRVYANTAALYQVSNKQWQTGYTYSHYDTVVKDETLYMCTSTGDAHVSGTFLTDYDSGYWVPISHGTIDSDVTITIGSGGDYDNFVDCWKFLKDKRIPDDVSVTLSLSGNLTLNTSAAYTWPDGTLAAWAGRHPDGRNITIQLNGHEITVGDGSDTVHGIYANNCTININANIATSFIRAQNDGTGFGVYATTNGFINIENGSNLTIGASGLGFNYGLYARANGYIFADDVQVNYNGSHGIFSFGAGLVACSGCSSSYNGGSGAKIQDGSYLYSINSTFGNNSAYGIEALFLSGVRASSCTVSGNSSGAFYASDGSHIDRTGASGAQATSSSPTVDTVGNANSYVN
jgi:hypothetical protein